MGNPFNTALDWTLQGKYAEVQTDEHLIRGWVERVHHSRGSVIMHDCERKIHPKYEQQDDWSRIGSVFVRTANTITTLKEQQSKEIKLIDPRVTVPFEVHDMDFEPVDKHMRGAYRNGFTGSFPVVRELPEQHEEYDTNDRYQVLNGHKRIEAAKRVGLIAHPMEVVRCTDIEAQQLFDIAHREQQSDEDDENPIPVPGSDDE